MKHKILSNLLNDQGNQVEISYEYVGNGRISIEMDGTVISKSENLDNSIINYQGFGIPEQQLLKDHQLWLEDNS